MPTTTPVQPQSALPTPPPNPRPPIGAPLQVQPAAPSKPSGVFGSIDAFRKTVSQQNEVRLRSLGAPPDRNQRESSAYQQGLGYIRTLLVAHRRQASYVAQLRSRFPEWQKAIEEVSKELATIQEAKSSSTALSTETLAWPPLNELSEWLRAQGQNKDPRVRLAVAADLCARLRLRARDESFRDIERTLPELRAAARVLAASVSPTDYAVLRQVLLQLPLADTNRIYLIRNLAIDMQQLAGQATLRNQIHNNASPANVGMVADLLTRVFVPGGTPAPTPDDLSVLMQLRRHLIEGQVAPAQALLDRVAPAFASCTPPFDAAQQAISQGRADAHEQLDSFLTAHLQRDENEGVVLRETAHNGITYTPVEILDKIALLYQELCTVYDPAHSVQRLEDLFPYGASEPIQTSLLSAMSALTRAEDHAALQAISTCRRLIYARTHQHGPIASHVLAERLAEPLGPVAPHYQECQRSIVEGKAGADQQLNEVINRIESSTYGPSLLVVKSISPGRSAVQASAEAIDRLNAFIAAAVKGDAQAAAGAAAQLRAHFSGYRSFDDLMRAVGSVVTFDAPREVLSRIERFLSANDAQTELQPGTLGTLKELQPLTNGRSYSPQAIRELQDFVEKCQMGDTAGAEAAGYGVRTHFSNHPNYHGRLSRAVDLARTQPALAALFAELFIRKNCRRTDEQVRQSLQGTTPPVEAAAIEDVLQLRRAVERGDHAPGRRQLPLMLLDGALESVATSLLAKIGTQPPSASAEEPAWAGRLLSGLAAGLQQAVASGVDDLRVDLMVKLPEWTEAGAGAPPTPALSESLRSLRKLMASPKLNADDLGQLARICEHVTNGVWQHYQQLKGLFEPRLERIAAEKKLGDPAFVDNLIKEGPLTHVKALADTARAWALEKLGQETEVGETIQNPPGLQTMSDGRVLLKKIIIATSVDDIPPDVTLDHNTLLVLSTVGNETISLAGSLLVGRDEKDGSGAGGQFSHIFVWTRNMGIAGASFENAVQVLKTFEKTFADRLNAGEEIYLEVDNGSMRLAPASVARARGWLRAGEEEALRPGVSTMVRFLAPNDAGSFTPQAEGLHVSIKPQRKLLPIDIAYPMADIDGAGGSPLSLEELTEVGPRGRFVDSLVGPKAGVLARLGLMPGWGNVIPPGIAFPFAQVRRLLDDCGLSKALCELEPALAMHGDAYWSSRFCTDPAYRREQCEAIRELYRQRLGAYLFNKDGSPNEIAIREILAPLRGNPALCDSDGALRPLVLRSSANAEDTINFNAAGKHESRANLRDDRAIVSGFIDVVSSLWRPQAADNRWFFGVDSRSSAMAVLAQPMLNATVSGVLVTRDDIGSGGPQVYNYQATRGLFGGVSGAAQIQTARLGPDASSRTVQKAWAAHTEMRPRADGSGVEEVVVQKSLQDSENLLTPAQQQELYVRTSQIQQFFAEEIHPGHAIDLDIEFLIADGHVKILQARPLPSARG